MDVVRIGGMALLAIAASCAPHAEREIVRLDGYEPATGASLAAEGWATDLSRLEVPLSSIRTAHLPRAAFVPIVAEGTEPAADCVLDDTEPVIVVRGADGMRGWPVTRLLRRELVLDDVDGVPVAVTYCSLCATARVWDRRLAGETLDLAVSGMLLHGNSLLTDRATDSLWRQNDGRAVAGAHAGTALREIPSWVLSLGALRRAAPDAGVLPLPGPAREPPLKLLRADEVAAGTPPAWLEIACERPLEPLLVLPGAEDDPVPAAGDGPRNVDAFVIFHDPGCALPFGGAAERDAPAGSAFAFRRDVDGRRLTFERTADGLADRETGSRWTLLGDAVAGPLAGTRLEPAPHAFGFRFAVAPGKAGAALR
jgi:Protein of unknown function (DUF3179)